MTLEGARPQKGRQRLLPFEATPEKGKPERSQEAPTAGRGDDRLGTGRLLEEVVQRDNLKVALERVRQNKGSPGIEGRTVDELLP